MSFQGKKNIYVCEECKGHIVTVDRDAGTTPFMIPCKSYCNPLCLGHMKSSMYRVFDQEIGASHEWYAPSALEYASKPPHWLDHVSRGGLILRKVEGR